MRPVKIERPKDDTTADGRRIVYQIWRDDLAEALILPAEPVRKTDENK